MDQEQHQVVDLLPDRAAATLAAWLHAHPGVQIVTRDRAGAYADGIRRGALDADQVADTFHVISNLRDAVERFFSRRHAALRTAVKEVAIATSTTDTSDSAERRLTRTSRQQHERRARRVACYQDVRHLQAQGVSLREIGRRLHLARKTVRRFAHAATFPERQRRHRSATLLTRYEPYLRQRWAEGCHTVTVLWREVRDRGFRGGYSSFAGHLKRWRESGGADPVSLSLRVTPVSVRQASWWVLCRDHELTTVEQETLRAVERHCPEVRVVRALAHRFRALTNGRQAELLMPWLADVERSGVPELRGFARSLRLPWNHGPTEDQINRLKMLKHQMYGRAGLPLLKRRFLFAPCGAWKLCQSPFSQRINRRLACVRSRRHAAVLWSIAATDQLLGYPPTANRA